MSELLDGYPVVVSSAVLWGEMDPHGHINNVWFFRYMENARIAYYEAIDKYAFEKNSGIGFMLAATECRFHMPLVYPDTAAVGARVTEIQEDRLVMAYLIVSRVHQRVAARGQATIVAFDHAKGRKAALPDTLRQRILALQEGSVN